MNRIIIIGNGFDLAHGLKTRYEDFINWYFDEWVQKLRVCHKHRESDELCEYVSKNNHWYNVLYENYNIITKQPDGKGLIYAIKGNPYFDYKQSRFLERITKCIEKNNWVDIEKEYYNLLSLDFESSDNESIAKLNNELAFLKSQLIAYLNSIEKEFINDSIVKGSIKAKMLEPINPRDISIRAKKNIWTDFVKNRLNNSDLDELLGCYCDNFKAKIRIKNFKSVNQDQINYMGINSINDEEFPRELFYPDNILLLNFNYTRTADLYLPNEEIFKVNHIHGDLSDKSNIIFGYGDELDDNYKNILKQDNNEYLKNIKSINYLNSTNYREMLSYIESSPYQIYIMGHSCGLSDKTLLNTLFEHDNCVSIKPFYYINNEGFDNYTEIVQNISRNFTDMKLMRDRVVNKTFCKTLE